MKFADPLNEVLPSKLIRLTTCELKEARHTPIEEFLPPMYNKINRFLYFSFHYSFTVSGAQNATTKAPAHSRGIITC